MKRSILLLVLALLFSLLAGCTGYTQPSETIPATEPETEAPYIDTPLDEPEWTLSEGELRLEDDDNIYAEGDDILYFAIVSTDDGGQELRFRFDEETTGMLSQQSPDNAYYITFNGEKIGSATLSDDCTVAIIGDADATEEITALASKIRGLE